MLRNYPFVLICLFSIFGYILADDLPEIEVVGNKFFYSNNGSQFLIRGIAYQENPTISDSGDSITDPLANPETCKRDVKLFQESNTNTLRVYAVNTSLDHDECMKTFADAGIYIIADLSEPDLSINRDSPEWNLKLYERYTDVVDMFANYSNVLGFFAGNEVSNNKSNTDASAFVKAAVRDTKKYISDKNYRSIPVGYSSNDDEDIRVAIGDYFACGDIDERADFFGINMYEWCGDSSFKSSGYEARTEEYKNLTIPIFFSEYGCNADRPRKFTEIGTIYGDDMTDVWSGGIVYMYFQEANDYGLVSIDGDDVKTLDDYNNYKSEILRVSPTSAASSAASASAHQLSCPTEDKNWKASTDLPPTPDDGLCSCMESSLSCVVGDSVDSDDYSDLFGIVCGEVSCDGINSNGTTGSYGAYSFCSSKQKLSFVLDLYYKAQGSAARACSFSGSASVKSASTQAACSTALAEAGASGLGTVSATVSGSGRSTATGSNGSSGSSSSAGSSSSSSGSSSRSGAAGPVVPRGEKVFASVMALLVVGGFTSILI